MNKKLACEEKFAGKVDEYILVNRELIQHLLREIFEIHSLLKDLQNILRKVRGVFEGDEDGFVNRRS